MVKSDKITWSDIMIKVKKINNKINIGYNPYKIAWSIIRQLKNKVRVD